ncbi:MAG: transposase [Candidatus Azambacteria bacterium]|nr:transposase [Candidatus Azambacteria bacterium]
MSLINMELFHTLNRGVDKRKIFIDDQDYFRFVHDLFEFNDLHWVNNNFYSFHKYNDIASRYIEKKPRKLLVDIHAFCLMPNHYHLLISSKSENAIPTFMKKLNMGYAKYFNEKYNRKGTLFESRYKSVLIKDEAHFIHLPYYIHLNPLDLVAPEWRDKKIKNIKKAENFLENYRWSSYLDYIGNKNFPSVIYRDFLMSFFGSSDDYKKSTQEWLKDLDINAVKDCLLE